MVAEEPYKMFHANIPFSSPSTMPESALSAHNMMSVNDVPPNPENNMTLSNLWRTTS